MRTTNSRDSNTVRPQLDLQARINDENNQIKEAARTPTASTAKKQTPPERSGHQLTNINANNRNQLQSATSQTKNCGNRDTKNTYENNKRDAPPALAIPCDADRVKTDSSFRSQRLEYHLQTCSKHVQEAKEKDINSKIVCDTLNRKESQDPKSRHTSHLSTVCAQNTKHIAQRWCSNIPSG